MKKYFIIKDAIQTTEEGKPLFLGKSYDKLWVTIDGDIKLYETIEAAEEDLDIIQDGAFQYGYYLIETFYTNN